LAALAPIKDTLAALWRYIKTAISVEKYWLH